MNKLLLILVGLAVLVFLFYGGAIAFFRYTPQPVVPAANPSTGEAAIKETYRSHIVVAFTDRLEANRYGGRGSPVYVGEVMNDGGRTVRNIRLRIFYLDFGNRPIFEQSVSIQNELQPGFIAEFEYGGKNVPAAWSDRKISYQIINLDF